ncbi:hypothetical protein PENTCL1PPCAC_9860, partial [Pristionchus entomophagus]
STTTTQHRIRSCGPLLIDHRYRHSLLLQLHICHRHFLHPHIPQLWGRLRAWGPLLIALLALLLQLIMLMPYHRHHYIFPF